MKLIAIPYFTDSEVVGEGGSRWNSALRHSRRSVHAVGVVLEEAVEVQTGRLVSQGIVHIRNDSVGLAEVENDDRSLSIDADDRPFLQTIRVGSHPSDVPTVG